MTTATIIVPVNKRQAFGKIYLDELLCGTEVSGPALVNADSFEFAWFNSPTLTPSYIPVLALFSKDENIDTFNFRAWCNENYPRFEQADDQEGFENAQIDIYCKILNEVVIYLEQELSVDLELMQQNWAKGVYRIAGV